MSTSLRPPRDEDLHLVYEIVAADDCNELGKPDLDESDITEWWSMPHHDRARDAWILERDGTAVGYGFTHDRNREGKFATDVWVVDEADEEGFDTLLAAARARALELAEEQASDKRQLVTWSVVGRAVRAQWLAARGFAKVRRFYRMEIELAEATAPSLAAGVTITAVGTDEADRRTFHQLMQSAFVDHWGYAPVDYDTWLARVSASPNLDWETVWIARLDGVPAAGLKMRLYDDIAFIDTVGTLKEHRSSGLGSALLRTAFAESLRRGQPRVELGVDTENESGAVAVYEKAGMSVAFAHDEWLLDLAPAAFEL